MHESFSFNVFCVSFKTVKKSPLRIKVNNFYRYLTFFMYIILFHLPGCIKERLLAYSSRVDLPTFLNSTWGVLLWDEDPYSIKKHLFFTLTTDLF